MRPALYWGSGAARSQTYVAPAALDAGLAGELVTNAPLALRASKAVLRQQTSWDEETFWREQGAIIGPVFASEDAIEGGN